MKQNKENANAIVNCC